MHFKNMYASKEKVNLATEKFIHFKSLQKPTTIFCQITESFNIFKLVFLGVIILIFV